MEIVGVGVDIVECLRIGRMIEQYGESFLNRIYTRREIQYCQARKRATEHFAGRWAAKEAVLKALGIGARRRLNWTDLEVRNDQQGKPQVLLGGAARDLARTLRIADLMVSIAHCRAYATAYALAMRAPLPAAEPRGD